MSSPGMHGESFILNDEDDNGKVSGIRYQVSGVRYQETREDEMKLILSFLPPAT